jgi:hypothetical protein
VGGSYQGPAAYASERPPEAIPAPGGFGCGPRRSRVAVLESRASLDGSNGSRPGHGDGWSAHARGAGVWSTPQGQVELPPEEAVTVEREVTGQAEFSLFHLSQVPKPRS